MQLLTTSRSTSSAHVSDDMAPKTMTLATSAIAMTNRPPAATAARDGARTMKPILGVPTPR
jgi:hypothetical protein